MYYFEVDRNIRLKMLEHRHADELYFLVDKNRSYLREWLPWVDGTRSPEDTKEFIRQALKQFARNNGFQSAIFYKEKLAGCIGVHEIDWNNRKTSIGYWLSSEYQGKGIMTKSCKAVIEYLFTEMKLNRIEIRAAEFNRKSRAIPERLGFTQEGMIRNDMWVYDHYVDHVVYGMLAEEWKTGFALQ